MDPAKWYHHDDLPTKEKKREITGSVADMEIPCTSYIQDDSQEDSNTVTDTDSLENEEDKTPTSEQVSYVAPHDNTPAPRPYKINKRPISPLMIQNEIN